MIMKEDFYKLCARYRVRSYKNCMSEDAFCNHRWITSKREDYYYIDSLNIPEIGEIPLSSTKDTEEAVRAFMTYQEWLKEYLEKPTLRRYKYEYVNGISRPKFLGDNEVYGEHLYPTWSPIDFRYLVEMFGRIDEFGSILPHIRIEQTAINMLEVSLVYKNVNFPLEGVEGRDAQKYLDDIQPYYTQLYYNLIKEQMEFERAEEIFLNGLAEGEADELSETINNAIGNTVIEELISEEEKKEIDEQKNKAIEERINRETRILLSIECPKCGSKSFQPIIENESTGAAKLTTKCIRCEYIGEKEEFLKFAPNNKS